MPPKSFYKSKQQAGENGDRNLDASDGDWLEASVSGDAGQAMAEAGVDVPGFETGFVENYFRVFRKTNLAGISGIGACPAVPRWYQCGCQSPEAGPPGRNHMCYLPFSVSKPIGKCSVFAQVYRDKPGHHVLYLEKSRLCNHEGKAGKAGRPEWKNQQIKPGKSGTPGSCGWQRLS